MSADARGESRVYRCLPRDVARPDLLYNGTGDEVIHVALVKRGLRNEALVGEPLQIHGELILVYRRGQGERQAHPVDDDDVLPRGVRGDE